MPKPGAAARSVPDWDNATDTPAAIRAGGRLVGSILHTVAVGVSARESWKRDVARRRERLAEAAARGGQMPEARGFTGLAIGGVAVGGVVLLLLYLMSRRKKQQEEEQS